MDEEIPVHHKDLFPVRIEHLSQHLVVPCNLYYKINSERFSFFAIQGHPISKTRWAGLLENGVSHLYVDREDAVAYFNLLKEELRSAVNDPHLPAEYKAKLLYNTSLEILQRAFDDPRAIFVEKAHEIISFSVEVIFSDDNVTSQLIRLASHEPSTYVHATNVGIFGTAIAKRFFGDSSFGEFKDLGISFFLHDLGKCKIPVEILNFPGPLSRDQFEVIKTHPEEGYKLLQQSGHLSEEAKIITLQHHEREDGSGYPYGLTGDKIHPYAKICRMADVYEALTSDRPYRKSLSTYEALKEMQQEVGDLDQALFEAFIHLFEK